MIDLCPTLVAVVGQDSHSKAELPLRILGVYLREDQLQLLCMDERV